MDYEKKYKDAQKWIESIYSELSHEQQMEAEAFFPELRESEGERVRKEILSLVRYTKGRRIGYEPRIHQDKMIAWLEKQGEPTDNDMVEALRTEYEKGKADAFAEMEKPTWSVEDMSKVQRICMYLDEAKKYYADITEVRECIDWLKSLKDRYTWKPSKGQLECLGYAIDKAEKDYSPLANNRIYLTLKALKEELEKLKG